MSPTQSKPEWVANMEAALAEHYGQPIRPVSEYCKGFESWLTALEQMVKRDDLNESDHRDVTLTEIARMAPALRLSIYKSNLLARLIYGGQELRTEPCPEHKGRWSGCYFDKTCECMDGMNVTGWLPNEDAEC